MNFFVERKIFRLDYELDFTVLTDFGFLIHFRVIHLLHLHPETLQTINDFRVVGFVRGFEFNLASIFPVQMLCCVRIHAVR